MFSSLRNRVALSKSKTNSNDGLAKSKTKTKTSTNRYKKHTNRIELTTSSSSSSSSALVNKENILNKIDEEETEKQVDSKYTLSSSAAALALSKEMASNSKNNICSSVLTDPFNKLKIESTKSSSATLTAVAVATSSSMFSPTNQAAKYSQSISETSPEVSPRGRFADECEYRMNHPKRGIAVIINNKRFDPRLEMVSNLKPFHVFIFLLEKF